MKLKLGIAVIMAVNLAACATVTRGKNDTVNITSEPTAANVVISEILNKYDGAECTTPCEVELNRKGSYTTTVSKDGYSSFTTTLVPKFSTGGGAGFAGNILIGGVIGAGVDAATGAMNDLSPNPLNVILSPSGEESYIVDDKGNKIDPVIGEEKGEMKKSDKGKANDSASLQTPETQSTL